MLKIVGEIHHQEPGALDEAILVLRYSISNRLELNFAIGCPKCLCAGGSGCFRSWNLLPTPPRLAKVTLEKNEYAVTGKRTS